MWQFFDVERQKAGLWCTAAGPRRETEEAVQKGTRLQKVKAGVTNWLGGEKWVEMDEVTGSNPGECEKMGRKRDK